VFIGGLSSALSEGDVLAVFSQWGEVEDLHLVRDEATGASRGFAFLKYEDWRSTVLAVDNANGAVLLERTLRVDHKPGYEPPRPKAEPGADGAAAGVAPAPAGPHRPGHAYEGRALKNEFDLEHGVDFFRPRAGDSGGGHLLPAPSPPPLAPASLPRATAPPAPAETGADAASGPSTDAWRPGGRPGDDGDRGRRDRSDRHGRSDRSSRHDRARRSRSRSRSYSRDRRAGRSDSRSRSRSRGEERAHARVRVAPPTATAMAAAAGAAGAGAGAGATTVPSSAAAAAGAASWRGRLDPLYGVASAAPGAALAVARHGPGAGLLTTQTAPRR
jgi:RNA-binding motif X-linked protein 2